MRLLVAALAGAIASVAPAHAQETAKLSATPGDTISRYRLRVLGVYDAASGAPLSGADVTNLQTGVSSKTNASGLIFLSFLPDGGGMVRVRKVGYAPVTRFIAVSPSDTAPVTEVLSASTVTLPTVTTSDSSPKYISPLLQGFERRRHEGFGHFITEAELRKSDEKSFENVINSLPGIIVSCRYVRSVPSRVQATPGAPPPLMSAGTVCSAWSLRKAGCKVAIFLDGMPQADVVTMDLAKMHTRDFGAVEYYEGPSEIPPEFNATGSACGVLLLWTRER